MLTILLCGRSASSLLVLILTGQPHADNNSPARCAPSVTGYPPGATAYGPPPGQGGGRQEGRRVPGRGVGWPRPRQPTLLPVPAAAGRSVERPPCRMRNRR